MDLTYPAWRGQQFPGLARARIQLTYSWRHGALPSLDDPVLFNEWVQWRKMHDRDIRMPLLADKLRAKDFVAARIGDEWVIPTIWDGTELPAHPNWPSPFVLKSRHGCNQYAFVFDDQADWSALHSKAKRWMRHAYGFWLDEWLYSQIPLGLLVEPFIGEGQNLPTDYKFYVFGGRVEFVQVHLDRGGNHRWIVFDRNWSRVSSITGDADPPQPFSLTKMIEAAEELGSGFDFVRVDLYDVRDKPLFGEMTFYPGSGLDPFNPVSLDALLGGHWSRARQA